jgi:high-affinity iron transporter
VLWAEFLPNLLIGLREGLEAGLVVTILASALRRADPERSLAAVWVGVATAIAVALSFGAVLTFTSAAMSPTAQATFSGILSVIAVALVTWMVFWLLHPARGDGHGRATEALTVGVPALVLTAFFAVSREGLESGLFVWTNARAIGTNAAPILGAVTGFLLALLVCMALYRQLLRLELRRYATATGAVLLVLAAGVLAYGIGDLQEAGILPTGGATAFDLGASAPPGSWWVEVLRGVTNLTPRMSWLQVAGYVGFLAVTLPLLLLPSRASRSAAAPVAAAPAVEIPAAEELAEPGPSRLPETLTVQHVLDDAPLDDSVLDEPTPEDPVVEPVGAHARRTRWILGVGAITVPVVVASLVIGLDGLSRPSSSVSAASPVHITDKSCAEGWAAPPAGLARFAVTNFSAHAVDVELVVADGTAVAGAIEVLGPGTTRELAVTVPSQRYRWVCAYDGLPTRTSPIGAVHGSGKVRTVSVPTVRATDLAPALSAYRAYVATTLGTLRREVSALQAELARGDGEAAKAAWLTAHQTYHRLGGAYDAFGADGKAVDGLAQGLPRGVDDPGFRGFHKIERDLWSGVNPRAIAPEAAALGRAVDVLVSKLPSFTFDPKIVPLRAQEMLEDATRFSLTGQDDNGSGTSLATALADTDGTLSLVRILTPMLERQSPGLAARATAQLTELRATYVEALRGGRWTPIHELSRSQRHAVNAATGQVLETLSVIPELLEVRA